MTGLELVVGYVAAWAWQKARRVAGRADTEVDRALDAGMDRLHDLVAGKLAGEPALARLEIEAATDLDASSVSLRTSQRVQLALEEAAETDRDFAARLDQLVAELQAVEQRTGRQVGVDVGASGAGSIVAGRDITGIASAGDGAVNIQHR